MKLFYKRPLSLILCIMLGGLAFFTRGGRIVRILIAAAAVILLIAFAVSLIIKRKRAILLASSLALFFAIAFSNIYFDNWFYVEKRFDGEVTVTGKVTELVSESFYSANYIVKADNIDNAAFSSYKLSVYFDRETSDKITVGSTISFKCRLEEHSNKNAEPYRYADGISAVCEDVSELTIIKEDGFVLGKYFSDMREWLTRHAIALSDKNSGAMVSALLLGERGALSPEVSLDFERLGITHILALSGMHLALISLAIDKLLSLFFINKKIRVITSAILAFLYMALTGFPSSVLRAGIMLMISSVVYLISREPDTVTSLFLSVTIIIFISPYAIFDISLWLSALATLGVIVYAEWNSNRQESDNKIISYFTDSLIISAFAICSTLLMTTLSFDDISIISPIATLIFTVLTTVIMYLGMIMLLIGWLIPVGFVLKPIVRITCYIAEIMSSADVYVSENYILIEIIVIILSIIFFAFILLDIKRKRIVVASIITVFCTLYLTAGVIGYINNQDDIIFYTTEKKYNEFVIRSDGESCLISSSQHSKSSGYTALSALEEAGITHLDKYYITNLSRNLEEDLNVVLSNVLTDELYLPSPKNDDEKSIIEKIYTFIEDYHTKIILYNSDDKTKVGNFEIIPAISVAYGEGTAQNAFFIHGDGMNILYLSSGLLDGNYEALAKECLAHAGCVIFGSHGKIYKNSIYLEADYNSLGKIIVDGENIFLTQENAVYYSEKGCEIISHPKSVILFD